MINIPEKNKQIKVVDYYNQIKFTTNLTQYDAIGLIIPRLHG